MAWGVYKNGNATVMINLTNGTKIRETQDDEFRLDFPESIDVNCTNQCNAGCEFCYANCTPDGKHADIMGAKFVDTLRPYTEVALQVNDLRHPALVQFLHKLKSKRVIANITVNQIHFEKKEDFIKKLVDSELIKGIGVSLRDPTPEFIRRIKRYPNAVIHTINGVLSKSDIERMSGNDLKILILGYKNLGRGVEYQRDNQQLIKERQNYLKNALPKMFDEFQLVSFDNLALKQLNVKSILTPEQWEEFFMGEEGTSSMFIDLVKGKYGVSSICSESSMHPITDSIDEMFAQVKKDSIAYNF